MKFQKIICIILFGYSVIFASIVNAKPNRSFPLDTTIWQNLNIPVCWEDINQNAFLRGQVKDAVESTWELNSQLDFTGWTQCPTGLFDGIRIGVKDTVNGPHVQELGNELEDVQDGMILNFAMRNWKMPCPNSVGKTNCIKLIAVHEFGHALGFTHEQNREDKPGTCTLDKQGNDGNVIFTEWDIDSIMNYCNPHRTESSKLSSVDILTVQTYYGRIPTYSARTLQIPVAQIGGEIYRISLSDSDGDGNYTLDSDTSSTTTSQSSKPAIYNASTSILKLPLVKVVDEADHVLSLYSVEMQWQDNGKFFTVSKITKIQPVPTSI
jgi:hypothetical protein